jgi:F-type H+-transporting ATPase subunit delta
MAELAVVRRYARALFDTANRAKVVEQVEGDLKTVDQALRTVPRLERVLRAPTVSSERKRELLQHVFGTRVSQLTLRFLTLLIDRRREGILPDVYAEYSHLADEFRNIQAVEVTSATMLTDAERERLAAALSRRTGKRIVLRVRIQPEILGGLVVRMGDTIIDGSVRTRLAQLRQHLLTGRSS